MSSCNWHMQHRKHLTCQVLPETSSRNLSLMGSPQAEHSRYSVCNGSKKIKMAAQSAWIKMLFWLAITCPRSGVGRHADRTWHLLITNARLNRGTNTIRRPIGPHIGGPLLFRAATNGRTPANTGPRTDNFITAVSVGQLWHSAVFCFSMVPMVLWFSIALFFACSVFVRL